MLARTVSVVKSRLKEHTAQMEDKIEKDRKRHRVQHETHVLSIEATVEEPVIQLDHHLEEVKKVTIEDIESMKAALFVLQKHHREFPLDNTLGILYRQRTAYELRLDNHPYRHARPCTVDRVEFFADTHMSRKRTVTYVRAERFVVC